jgi:hypothetical protein
LHGINRAECSAAATPAAGVVAIANRTKFVALGAGWIRQARERQALEFKGNGVHNSIFLEVLSLQVPLQKLAGIFIYSSPGYSQAGVIQAHSAEPGSAGLLTLQVMVDAGDNPLATRPQYVRLHLHTTAKLHGRIEQQTGIDAIAVE